MEERATEHNEPGSGEDAEKESVMLPILKFLSETYRAVLDILRSNSKLEFWYHSAVLGPPEFAKVYKRKTEFQKDRRKEGKKEGRLNSCHS